MGKIPLITPFFILIPLLLVAFLAPLTAQALEGLDEAEPVYDGIAKYYDNRKCVVTVTLDDFTCSDSFWQNCLSMLTGKKIYHTVAVITNETFMEGWDFIQYWLDQGYTEVGSHSRNHALTPYAGVDPYGGKSRVSYEWQINGSKNDILGNLTLPGWWRYGEKEYVYAWIEPYGEIDETVRHWLKKLFTSVAEA